MMIIRSLLEHNMRSEVCKERTPYTHDLLYPLFESNIVLTLVGLEVKLELLLN